MEQVSQLGSALQVGAVGLICAYLLLRISPQLTELGKKVDRLSRAHALSLLAGTSDPQTRRKIESQAQRLLEELEE